MTANECPNHDAIIAVAKRMGVWHPKLVYSGVAGWELVGQREAENGSPLVWSVAKACGIAWGCGNHNRHQVDPSKFKEPKP